MTLDHARRRGPGATRTEQAGTHVGDKAEGASPSLLVNGRTQTHLPWPGFGQLAKDGTWHHDLFHAGGTPYDAAEIDLFRQTVRGGALPRQAF
jgi:hypothetical protein